MSFKLALSTATALGLLMGAAWAGSNNQAYIDQIGDDNSASITQGQENGSMRANLAGQSDLRMRQEGDDNEIDIDQVHNNTSPTSPGSQRNGVGIKGGLGEGAGVDQVGNGNYLRIYQYGANQVVFEVQQDGGASATTDSNNATVVQNGGTSARVSNIKQTFTGGGTDASNDISITQSGGTGNRVGNTSTGPRPDETGAIQNGVGNQLTVNQSGAGSNLLYASRQDNSASAGGTNIASVMQSGKGNHVMLIEQTNTGAGDNLASLSFVGEKNGTIGFSDNAALVGISQSRAVQTGSGNTLGFQVATGDNNSFGFAQQGEGNWINGVNTGDDHQVAIWQHGDDNVVDFAQFGTGHDLGVSMDGSDNHLKIRQRQSGNNMSVSITGSDNNNWPTSNSLTGDARAAYDVAHGYETAFVGQGSLYQTGSNNSLTMLVTGDLNSFATYQWGSDNMISHTMGGDANQAVVTQIGSNNYSNTTQTGGGNNLGVSQ
jgi:hypothetical protein